MQVTLIGAGAAYIDLNITEGTATGTTIGLTSGTGSPPANGGVTVTITIIATITVAGTFILKCFNQSATIAGTATWKSAGGNFGAATGYTAVRIA
jgi:hypothetical protein